MTGAGPGEGPGRWGAANLRVAYGPVLALDGVSLEVPPGQVTAVVGGDGAGKSTLLRCLAGTQAPQAGRVLVPGARQTGYLPASSGTYPDLTVAENLAFRAAAYGLPSAAARERAAALTEQAGLTGAAGRLAGQLSGGMRQKLGVICALLHEPGLLILDEPTTGVDPVSRAGLWRLVAGAAAGGAAVVVATTYLDDASRAASVLVLDGGRALAAGTPEEIVAALPGTITAPAEPPGPAEQSRSWRRAGAWRVWVPPGVPAPAGQPVAPDLQDAVTVAALAREAGQPPGTPGPASPASPAAGPGEPSGQRRAAGTTGPAADLAECAAVTATFGHFTAVRQVSLQVGPGEIVGLLGANGAGKTTLIRLLLGLLHPSAGTVALFGQPPSRGTRRRLGYVPQSLGLYDDLTVAENLAFSAAVFGIPAGRDAGRPGSARARRAIERPGEPQEPGETRAAGRLPVGQLPLGLQRRAAFAQALAHQPDLLILDEPTSGVDPLGRARLWDTVRSAAESGAGVLITTHYMEEAHECDRLIIMADGGVVAEGTPEQVTGDASVTVVTTGAWEAAFRRLAEAGLDVTLAGHTLRLPLASPDRVRDALGNAGAGVPVSTAPASLEERFFQLVQSAAAASAPPGAERAPQ
ncbi:MAG TPA: ATP-binding cassette domain-containing protein [Streptosporangiaceae bacterium]